MIFRRRLLLVGLTLVPLVVMSSCERIANDDDPPPALDAATTENVGGIEIHRDVLYRTVANKQLFLDVYLPQINDAPGILYAHGGSWSAGGKSGFTRGGVAFARSGFAVVVPIYRLAPPGGRWHAPAALQDVRAAAVWYRDNAESFGADPTRLAAVGSSAGGNLALLLGTTGEPGRGRADAVVSLSGPIDLPAAVDVGPDEVATVVNYLGCRLKECTALWRAMSPLFQVDPDSAPTYLINSEAELVPAAHTRAMARALRREGVPVQVDILPGEVHGIRLAPQVLPNILEFLEQHVGP